MPIFEKEFTFEVRGTARIEANSADEAAEIIESSMGAAPVVEGGTDIDVDNVEVEGSFWDLED